MSDFDPPAQLPEFDQAVLSRARSTSQRDVLAAAERQLETQLPRVEQGAREIAADVDSIQGSLGQQIVRGLFKRQFGVDLKTPAELELERLEMQAHQHRLQRVVAQGAIDNAFASFLSNKDMLNKHPDVIRAGITVDEKLLERPEEFVALSRIARLPIDQGLMHLAGLDQATPEQVRAAQTEEQIAARQRTITGEETATKTLKLHEAFRKGTSSVFRIVEQRAREIAEAGGEDFTGLDVSFDEDRGSAAFFSALPDLFVTAREAGMDPKDFGPLFLSSDFGKDIKDQLDEVPRDEDGNIMFGKKHAGATARAVFYLVKSIARIARMSRRPLGPMLTKMGVAGLDRESLIRFATEEAARLQDITQEPVTAEDLLRDIRVGLGGEQ